MSLPHANCRFSDSQRRSNWGSCSDDTRQRLDIGGIPGRGAQFESRATHWRYPLEEAREFLDLITFLSGPHASSDRHRSTGLKALNSKTCAHRIPIEVQPNESRLSCGALKKDSFLNLRAPSASSAG